MSLPFIVLVVAVMFLVLSQFGARLAARHSVTWYLVSGFIVLAAIRPDWLLPVAQVLGITLVSNMVLAGLTMFLFVQMLEQYSENARLQRQVVRMVSSIAAQSFPERVREPGDTRTRVLVVLPCYNESASLPVLVPRLTALQHATPDLDLDFCIVNDGSVDGTPEVLRYLAPRNHVTHHTNIGVSGGLRTGFLVAQNTGADFAVQCDSDGQHPIESIPALVRAARERGTDMLIGSRFAGGGPEGQDALASTTRLRRTGGVVITTLLGMFGAAARVSDPTSGFRVYSRRAMATLLQLMPDEYPEPESIALVTLAGLRVQELGVTMSPRTTGTSSLSGLKSLRFMTKVSAALLGLRLRSLMGGKASRSSGGKGGGAGPSTPVISLPEAAPASPRVGEQVNAGK